jgi:hypothetical protein
MQVPDNTNSRATADIIFTGGQIHTVNVQNDIVEAVAVGGGRILAMGSTPTFDPSPVLGHAKSSCTGPRSCPASLTPTATSPASAWAWCRSTAKPRACNRSKACKKRCTSAPRPSRRGPGFMGAAMTRRACANDAIRIATIGIEIAQTPLQMAALPTAEEFSAALMRASEAYLAAACTSVHDAGGLVGPAFGPCQDLVESGRLKLRIYAFATVNSLQHPVMGLLGAGVRSGFGDKRLRLGAFKVMIDGSSSGPTTATREPFTSNGQDCGILYWDQDGLDDLIGRTHRQGFQCTVHAVGTGASSRH